MKKPKPCLALWWNTLDIWEHLRSVENTCLQLLFSAFPLCSRMPIVFNCLSVIHRLDFFICLNIWTMVLMKWFFFPGIQVLFTWNQTTFRFRLFNLRQFELPRLKKLSVYTPNIFFIQSQSRKSWWGLQFMKLYQTEHYLCMNIIYLGPFLKLSILHICKNYLVKWQNSQFVNIIWTTQHMQFPTLDLNFVL